MDNEHCLPLALRIWNWINLIAFIICGIICLVLAIEGDKEMQEMLKTYIVPLVLGILSSAIVSGCIAMFAVKKNLKGLPQELENATQDLAELRQMLNPDTKSLSAEHNRIVEKVEEVDKAILNVDKTIAVADAKRENRYQNLDTSQKALADSVEKLNGFNYQLQTLKEQLLETQNTNAKLNFEIDNLKSENAKLKQKVRTRSSDYER